MSNDDVTTAIGLYHYGLSYQRAADALGEIKLRSTHPHAPRSFLYYHAIELYMKAFLRNSGLSVSYLKSLGHNVSKLKAKYVEHGGFLMDEDIEVLRLMQAGNSPMRSRYIETGLLLAPSLEALNRTAESLGETVFLALKKLGQPVRERD